MSLEPAVRFLPPQIDHLEAAAIPVDRAADLGIRAASLASDLPEWSRGYFDSAPDAMPALVFEWRSATGRTVEQVRPAVPIMNGDGREQKYLWPKGEAAVVHVALDPPAPKQVLIVEGTKQSRAAALYAPPETRVLGLGGCWNWMEEGIASPDLDDLIDGLPTIIAFDADWTTNRQVWDAAWNLQEACWNLGVKRKEVRILKMRGKNSEGLDDLLGKRPDAPSREKYLANLISAAAPMVKREAPKARKVMEVDPSRPAVDVSEDPAQVVSTLHRILIDKHDTVDMFQYGDTIAQVQERELRPVTPPVMDNVISESAKTYKVTRGEFTPALPEARYVKMMLARYAEWSLLSRRVYTPYLTYGGDVLAESGYDRASHTLVTMDSALDGFSIPEDPNPSDVAAATDFIINEVLLPKDFGLLTEAAVANALALFLTPFIRGLVPIVPLAVVDGIQAGVGKGKLINCLSILTTGRWASTLPWGEDDVEVNKVITSAFRTGAQIFAYDEAHHLDSTALARALTSAHWEDRVLGYSEMAQFPNNVTWIAMGNQVRVLGDMARRAYFIRLDPGVANPEDRAPEDFHRKDMEPEEWVRENRREVLEAIFTLIQAWVQAGRPHKQTVSFGSFQSWANIIAGILDTAGVKGFLTDLKERRSESDDVKTDWTNFLFWLRSEFGGGLFTSYQATQHLVADREAPKPPGYRRDPGGAYDAAELGRLLRKKRDVVLGNLVLRASDVKTANKTHWFVEEIRPFTPAPEPEPPAPEPLPGDGPVVFDIESSDAVKVWERRPEFTRIVGHDAAGDVEVTTDASVPVRAVEEGRPIVAHNGFGFDFHALEAHGLNYLDATDKGLLIDTMTLGILADPPAGRMKSGEAERHYSLNGLAARLGTTPKSDSMDALVAEHGGYDIPVDDERYRAYCAGDVVSAREAFHALPDMDDYARREMRVMGRLTYGITGQGFRVDRDLLAQRLAENAETIERNKAWLVDSYGLPLVGADGKPASDVTATKGGKEALLAAFTDLGACPERWSRKETRTKTGAISFGRDAMEWVQSMCDESERDQKIHLLCQTVMDLKGVRSIYGTVDKYLVGDRVHPTVAPYQSSGRLSITRPGLTVMGKRKGRHIERDVFTADEGCVLVAIDLDQIDMRAVAGHCQDPAYMAIFQEGRDLHTETAKAVWGDASLREQAKVIGHGWNYGLGVSKMVENYGVTHESAMAFVEGMRERFPRLVEWRKETVELGQTQDYLINGFGRRMKVSATEAFTQSCALMGQGTARDLMMEGVLRLPQHVVPMLRAAIHDELVFSIPVDRLAETKAEIMDAMTMEFRGVPITAGFSKDSVSWGGCYVK